jgi:hypothetical protein
MGKPCPKCRRMMSRKTKPSGWKPSANQKFYFAYFDYCHSCRHVQHYEIAKRFVDAPMRPPESAPDFLAQEGRPPWDTEMSKEPAPWIIPLPLMEW